MMSIVKSQTNKNPTLRFSGFNNDWQEKKLGNVGDVAMCKRILKHQTSSSGDIPFFKIGTFGKKPDAFIPKELFDAYKKKYLFPKKGDILLSASGTIGRMVVYDGRPSYFQDSNIVWLDNCEDLVTNKFLFFLYAKVKWPTASATIARLYNNAFKNIKVFAPSIQEQQKIADFLGSVDSWIESLNAQKTALETYKRGMMQKIFSQQIRFKDENGKNFSGWKKVELGNVVTFLKGKGISKDEVIENGKNECIRYGELYTDYGEVITEIKSKTDIPANESVLSVKGDILIPSSGETAIDIATVSCVNVDGVLLGGDLNILRPKQEQNGAFFAYYLSNFQNINIARLAQGNSVVHLYASHLKTLKIELPSFPEQEKIADFLISLDNLIESKQEQVTKAEQWKKGLMQKMFV